LGQTVVVVAQAVLADGRAAAVDPAHKTLLVLALTAA
tara:strand:+ start:772 stop:882 length:111 start_codon:yes stop_codon:yes gene_type:complete